MTYSVNYGFDISQKVPQDCLKSKTSKQTMLLKFKFFVISRKII